jgi:CrcB protein
VTPLLVLGVVLAGGVGAVARFAVDGVVSARSGAAYPLGTLLVNLSGSLVLGVVTGLVLASVAPDVVRLVVGTGFLGGYTTFSTASLQSVQLLQGGRARTALAYAAGTLLATTAAAGVGLWLGLLA